MEIKTDTILVTISIILGLIATLLFIATGLFKSPITDSMLVITFGTAVLYFTNRTGEHTLVQGGQILFSIAIVSSVLYVVGRFNSGELVLSGVFALFALGFLLSAYFYTKDKKVLTEKRIKIILIIVVSLFAIVAVIDVASATPTSEVSLNDKPSENTRTGVPSHTIGTLEVTNSMILPQEYDYPRHQVCLTGIDDPYHNNATEQDRPRTDTISYYDAQDMIFQESTVDIKVRYPLANASDTVVKMSETCPESTSEPTIHFLGERE